MPIGVGPNGVRPWASAARPYMTLYVIGGRY
jgi:hypothetical protein